MSKNSCLIIGGGISGLIAGNILQKKGFKVTVVDKGKGIGGRLATRRIVSESYGEGVFDYGAQYFSARDPRFEKWVKHLLKKDIVEEWSLGFFDSFGQPRFTNESHYRGVISNRTIAKHFAKNLEVYTNQKIEKIKNKESRWISISQTGQIYSSNILLLTPPVPQSLELLQNSLIPIPVRPLLKLEKISYSPCIAVLALLKSDSNIPKPGGIWFEGEPVSWIADNHKKGISPNGFAVTIHAIPKYSEKNWGKENNQIADELFSFSKKWLKADVADYQIHRWRYSQVVQTYDNPFLHLKDYGSIFMAGDAFGGGKIEGAAISGIEVAEAIIENYK